MAKKVTAVVKLQLQAGKATPGPPVGSTLGPYGINIPGFTKVTYRSLSWDFLGGVFFGKVAANNPDYFVSESDAKASPVVVAKGVANTELGIPNKLYASLLDDENAEEISEAIKSATKEDIGNGKVKLTLVLNDEENPAPIKATDKKAANFTSKLFPVMTAGAFRVDIMDNDDVSAVSLNYTDCTVELVYAVSTGEIVSMKQIVKYTADVEMGVISGKGTVTETIEYSNFIY